MQNLNVSVTIGGSNVTDYVVGIERGHSICDQVATGSIMLSFESPTTPDPYDEVVIYEMGTKVFTGYVVDVHQGRMPPEYTIGFADPAIKLQDYWVDQLYESGGETAEYWIKFFCDLASVAYSFDCAYANQIPNDYSWQYTSALEAIRQLIAIGGYHMISDPDGVIHFRRLPPTALLDISPQITGIGKETSITPSRNRTVLFGRTPIAAEATVTVTELGSREKTAVIATPYVEDQSYAQTLANAMADHFGQVEEIIVLEVEGDPDYRVGYYLSVTESWTGLNDYLGMVTGVKSSIGNSGYIMEITLDRFCPYIWGYMQERKLYASTHGSGVFVTENFGFNWRDINGTTLSGGALFVRGIDALDDTVWAATMSGVYHTDNATDNPGVTWADKTPSDLPPATARSDFDWTDIEMMPTYATTASGVVFTVGFAKGKVYLFKTDDYGSDWDYVEVY